MRDLIVGWIAIVAYNVGGIVWRSLRGVKRIEVPRRP